MATKKLAKSFITENQKDSMGPYKILELNFLDGNIQAAKTLLQAVLAQPVSEVFQNTSCSVRSNQYLHIPRDTRRNT
ncbi:hypothetical protein JZ751_026197, partial [Albula glossodonta]